MKDCPWNYKDDGICGRLSYSFWCDKHEEASKKVWEPPVNKEKTSGNANRDKRNSRIG